MTEFFAPAVAPDENPRHTRKPMIFWSAMRAAAIRRHAIVNLRLEGGCPLRWRRHTAPIRAIYGC